MGVSENKGFWAFVVLSNAVVLGIDVEVPKRTPEGNPLLKGAEMDSGGGFGGPGNPYAQGDFDPSAGFPGELRGIGLSDFFQLLTGALTGVGTGKMGGKSAAAPARGLRAELFYGNDDGGDRIRPKVTENEAKEARAIVVKERDTIKAKVTAASPRGPV
ncbi:hypothetical protein AK812_SmicGene32517 [Symbiodinium microadriaticum]|uniref:Uncharacterized protein n=1 Tax=Symbiodinium microadriaticum TaxID=2951 RepID=A0A1Q9CTW9_SYMMI|nr:hypothetical protein AK812_SmicGene32517 [Symbiodinium microadriaticum]